MTTVEQRAAYYLANREAIDTIRSQPQPPGDFAPWFCDPVAFREVVDHLMREQAPAPEPFDPLAEAALRTQALGAFSRDAELQRSVSVLPAAPGGGMRVVRDDLDHERDR